MFIADLDLTFYIKSKAMIIQAFGKLDLDSQQPSIFLPIMR